jgi:FKBP-type peptidyl-prolyl cis-trans isomerase 2
MKVVKFTLTSGIEAAFFLGTNHFVVTQTADGEVRISDGNHNNGGWKLHPKYTLESVVESIKNA